MNGFDVLDRDGQQRVLAKYDDELRRIDKWGSESAYWSRTVSQYQRRKFARYRNELLRHMEQNA